MDQTRPELEGVLNEGTVNHMRYKLPDDLECDHCILMMRYREWLCVDFNRFDLVLAPLSPPGELPAPAPHAAPSTTLDRQPRPPVFQRHTYSRHSFHPRVCIQSQTRVRAADPRDTTSSTPLRGRASAPPTRRTGSPSTATTATRLAASGATCSGTAPTSPSRHVRNRMHGRYWSFPLRYKFV